jgi:hypothetical protein
VTEGRNRQQNNPGQSQGGMGQQHQSDTGRAAQQGGVSGLGDSNASRASGQQGGAFGAGQEHQQDSQRGSQQGGQQGRQQGAQQGGQSGAGQQQQFDSQGMGQQGGGGAQGRFADQIREHMEVIDDSGQRCGTVDHVEGDRIKLARSGSGDGQHHYVPMSQVAGIEGNTVRLRERGDNDFGMER